MKVSVGARIIDGPFGGGNAFVGNLVNYFKENNIEVVYDLADDDIDIILLLNPLPQSKIATFNHIKILYYQKNINPNSISIQRINECDERKNTNFVNKTIIKSNKYIDITIFVSEWLKNLYESIGIECNVAHVIKGGPNKKIFNLNDKKKWNKKDKLKIVTHHWSNNYMKGFETYDKLDRLIEDIRWKDKIEFTYIGNTPKNFKFRNVNLIPPMNEIELSKELKKYHVYITGSMNEPSGNHHMEAAMSGLPILYINSGGIPEYCQKFGVEFESYNLEESLNALIRDYDIYYDNLKNYPYDFERAGNEYIKVFEDAILSKNIILKNRKFPNNYLVFLLLIKNFLKYYSFHIYSNARVIFGKIKRLIRLHD